MNQLRSMSRHALALATLLSAALPPGLSQAPGGRPRAVTVAAAADLRYALAEVASVFEKEQPNVQLQITYGSSGNFFAQLSRQAPFDIFLSADTDYPRRLVEGRVARKESLFIYAVGTLVIWARSDSPFDPARDGVRVLTNPAVHQIAIANPRHAPYGKAAEAALKKLGIYDQVHRHLIVGENISQAAQFVESGAADIGLIALSLADAAALRSRGRYGLVPRDCYPRLEQAGVILTQAKDPRTAQLFVDFIRSPRGQAILKRYGFRSPGE